MRIPAAVFRYVEHELYNLETTRRELAELRDDILLETPFCEVRVSGGDTSDTTRARAARLLTSAAINDITRVVNAIDSALDRLTEDHRAVYDFKYRQRRDMEATADLIPCSRATCYKLRRELVEMAALNLGKLRQI